MVDHIKSQGVNLAEGVQPSSITKLDSGRLLVSFTDGRPSEEFDTVLAAVGKHNLIFCSLRLLLSFIFWILKCIPV